MITKFSFCVLHLPESKEGSLDILCYLPLAETPFIITIEY